MIINFECRFIAVRLVGGFSAFDVTCLFMILYISALAVQQTEILAIKKLKTKFVFIIVMYFFICTDILFFISLTNILLNFLCQKIFSIFFFTCSWFIDFYICIIFIKIFFNVLEISPKGFWYFIVGINGCCQANGTEYKK